MLSMGGGCPHSLYIAGRRDLSKCQETLLASLSVMLLDASGSHEANWRAPILSRSLGILARLTVIDPSRGVKIVGKLASGSHHRNLWPG